MGDRREGRARSGAGDGERVTERRVRALEEPLDVRRLAGPYPRLEVRNPIRGTHYTVHLPADHDPDGAMCTCADFARRGLGTCKHIEAARRWLDERPEERADPTGRTEADRTAAAEGLWRRVDRRRASIASGPRRSPAARLREPGTELTRSEPKEEKEGVDDRGRGAPRTRPV